VPNYRTRPPNRRSFLLPMILSTLDEEQVVG